uniref:Ubiquitin carboxyl-terminal hydrolase n=1 Tax=Angiostrongylus cantonensis TaxID=6313 RepID=A0A158P6N9_ANGCA
MLLYSSAYHDARFGTVGIVSLWQIWSGKHLNPTPTQSIWQVHLMAKIGVETVECVDIISFDDEVLKDLPKPQLAVLLCLPDYEKVHALMAPVYDKLFSESVTVPENVFFMEQKIGNACGTFALFHALANVEDLVDLGSGPFRKWLEAAKGVRVDQRSALLANDSSLAAAHNEAAILGVSRQPAEVVHHFICYVNRDGTLFEIDSRAPFPRAIGVTSGDTLVKDVGAACKMATQWRALESNPETMNAGSSLHQTTYDALAASGASAPPDVFFMKQKIGNACGTFALFHSLANLEGVIDLGDGSFTTWLKEAKSLSSEERSDFLLKSEPLFVFHLFYRSTQLAGAHDEVARMGETEEPSDVEHHFICYVVKNGLLYEIGWFIMALKSSILDSCAPFPRSLGEVSDEPLVSAAGKHIKELMVDAGDISFSAMALVRST